MDVQIVVFDGFDEIDVFGPFEVLSAAGDAVSLVALEGARTVTSQRGVRLEATAGIGQPEVLIVPGGGWLDRAPEGAWAQAERGRLPRRIAEARTAGVLLASVCTGALLLAEAGVLTGRSATTNHEAFGELSDYDEVTVLPARVVDAGDVVTAAGLTAGLDLGLHLVERFRDRATADAVAAGIEYERQGRVEVVAAR